MRNFKSILAAAFCIAMVASCGKSTKISGVVADASQSEVIVKLLDVNRYKVLDTVKTDAAGAFKYSLDVAKGEPEFIYLFHGNTKIASLLLQNGDKVSVNADTLGNYSVTGSVETERLMAVEKAEADFADKFASTTAKLEDMVQDSEAANEVRRDLAKQYISYYHDRVKYIMENSHSLTVIPVLYQTIGENLPLFSQSTDAIHFRNMVDSLTAVYPQSKYVKALSDEATRRLSMLSLENRINTTEPVGFPDINLPDVKGNNVKLSDVDAKIIFVYFWSAGSAEQKMLNIDTLKPVYDKYHSKGFEIYSVSLDVDKSVWAAAVRNQNTGWINVCDGKGTSSPVLMTYPVADLPFVFVIKNGEFAADAAIRDEASIRKYLEANL